MDGSHILGVGKQSKLATLAQTSYEQLERTLVLEIKSLDKRIGELSYALRPQALITDTVVETQKQQEVRALLREKDELGIAEMYQLLAVSGDNDLVMRAIENR